MKTLKIVLYCILSTLISAAIITNKTIYQVVGECAEKAIADENDSQIKCGNPCHWWSKHIINNCSHQIPSPYTAWGHQNWRAAWDSIKNQKFPGYIGKQFNFNQTVFKCVNGNKSQVHSQSMTFVFKNNCYHTSNVSKKMSCIFTAYPYVPNISD